MVSFTGLQLTLAPRLSEEENEAEKINYRFRIRVKYVIDLDGRRTGAGTGREAENTLTRTLGRRRGSK